eukprot:scaffold72447_cov54-Attheya_sp.AAC.5
MHHGAMMPLKHTWSLEGSYVSIARLAHSHILIARNSINLCSNSKGKKNKYKIASSLLQKIMHFLHTLVLCDDHDKQ